jgi:hypothetical protein
VSTAEIQITHAATPILDIGLDLIDVPAKWRKVSPAAVGQLAESLKHDGLLQPIGLRVHPKDPDRYELLFGRHRIEGAKAAGWATIPARIFGTVNDTQARLMTFSENVHRQELAPAEAVAAMKELHAAYSEDFPERVGNRAGATAKHAKRGKAEIAPAGRAEAEEAAGTESFYTMMGQKTGLKKSQIKKYIHAGKNLSSEQLGVLAAANVVLEDIHKINKMKHEHIARAVALIAAGADAKVAIAEAPLPPGTTVEVVAGAPGVPDDQMTDGEWLQTYCGEVLERLKGAARAVYTTDALVYRRLAAARRTLRVAAKEPLAIARQANPGPFCGLVQKLVNLDHPKNWLPCGACGGSGEEEGGRPCGQCHKNGYVLQKEARR